jgi:hypothetical protein
VLHGVRGGRRVRQLEAADMNRCPTCHAEIDTVRNADELSITNESGAPQPHPMMVAAAMAEMMHHPEQFRFAAVPCGHEVSVERVDGELRIKEDIQ